VDQALIPISTIQKFPAQEIKKSVDQALIPISTNLKFPAQGALQYCIPLSSNNLRFSYSQALFCLD